MKRPLGQRKPANEDVPTYGPSRNLDFELELGFYIGVPTQRLAKPSRSAGRPSTFSGFASSTLVGARRAGLGV